MIEDIRTKWTYDSFIQKVKTIKTYRSNANKEYKVMKVKEDTLVLRDLRTKKDYEVSALQIYRAMADLSIVNCTVANMRKYVGTSAAPASAALVFWACGRGTAKAHLKMLSDMILKSILEK